jgi:hypothetical protein
MVRKSWGRSIDATGVHPYGVRERVDAWTFRAMPSAPPRVAPPPRTPPLQVKRRGRRVLRAAPPRRAKQREPERVVESSAKAQTRSKGHLVYTPMAGHAGRALKAPSYLVLCRLPSVVRTADG